MSRRHPWGQTEDTMNYDCPPAVFNALHLHVHGGAGRYELHIAHSHRGFPPAICAAETVGDLTWHELLDVLEVVLEQRRPAGQDR